MNTVIALVTKPSKYIQMGIGIGLNSKGDVKIAPVDEHGLFAKTDLKVGMKIETINISIFLMYDEALSLLKEADHEVVIVASTTNCTNSVAALVKKPFKDDKLGIVLTGQGTIKITSIAEDDIFAKTNLKAGMNLETINSARFATANEAMSLLKSVEDRVAVVASNTKYDLQIPPETEGKDDVANEIIARLNALACLS